MTRIEIVSVDVMGEGKETSLLLNLSKDTTHKIVSVLHAYVRGGKEIKAELKGEGEVLLTFPEALSTNMGDAIAVNLTLGVE